MTSYGYKLLRVELYRGRRHTPVNFATADRMHYLDRVFEDVKGSIERARTRQASSVEAIDEAGDLVIVVTEDVVGDMPEPGDDKGVQPSVVRFDSVTRLNSAVLMTMKYGVVGEHSQGIDPYGRAADQDLSKLAAVRDYRALLIAPARGEHGILAVEVVSRSHVGTLLHRRLKQAAEGKHEFNLRARGTVADADAVKRAIGGGRVRDVQLYATAVGSDSAVPGRPRHITIDIPVGRDEDTLAEKITERVNTWRGRDGEAVSAREEAKNLASILWKPVKDVDFDDAQVSYLAGERVRRLRPIDTAEGFIYDLGDEQLDDTHFVWEVASTVRSLFLAEQMDMEDDWDAAIPDDPASEVRH